MNSGPLFEILKTPEDVYNYVDSFVDMDKFQKVTFTATMLNMQREYQRKKGKQ